MMLQQLPCPTYEWYGATGRERETVRPPGPSPLGRCTPAAVPLCHLQSEVPTNVTT
jgi:hypothetical protein